jgi:Cu+-exporting ATPase
MKRQVQTNREGSLKMTKLASSTKAIEKATIDPVCGMDVVPGKTKLVAVHDGHSYWFCAEACRDAFEKDPEKYLGRKAVKPPGMLGKFLHRLAMANEQKYGKGGKPSCCQ